MAQWLQEGRVRTRTQLHHGFENTVPAFLGMLRGDNLGKTLVQIAWPANDLPSPHSP
jgi:NADPH-dependent curcumin reductase CurA